MAGTAPVQQDEKPPGPPPHPQDEVANRPTDTPRSRGRWRRAFASPGLRRGLAAAVSLAALAALVLGIVYAVDATHRRAPAGDEDWWDGMPPRPEEHGPPEGAETGGRAAVPTRVGAGETRTSTRTVTAAGTRAVTEPVTVTMTAGTVTTTLAATPATRTLAVRPTTKELPAASTGEPATSYPGGYTYTTAMRAVEHVAETGEPYEITLWPAPEETSTGQGRGTATTATTSEVPQTTSGAGAARARWLSAGETALALGPVSVLSLVVLGWIV